MLPGWPQELMSDHHSAQHGNDTLLSIQTIIVVVRLRQAATVSAGCELDCAILLRGVAFDSGKTDQTHDANSLLLIRSRARLALTCVLAAHAEVAQTLCPVELKPAAAQRPRRALVACPSVILILKTTIVNGAVWLLIADGVQMGC
jgi:hypothetical protein